jgi:hypothetical protein
MERKKKTFKKKTFPLPLYDTLLPTLADEKLANTAASGTRAPPQDIMTAHQQNQFGQPPKLRPELF